MPVQTQITPERSPGAGETLRRYGEYVMTGVVKAVQPVVIERAEGAEITDVNGKRFIDCFAGISVVNAGHCNPEVVKAAQAQAEKLIHCCSYMYHVQPVAELAEKLAQITPGRLKKSFFANSGAEAVEGAMKLARLYTGRHEFLALDTAFHGRTFGALSVTGNRARKRAAGPFLAGVTFVPVPYTYRMPFRTPEECGEFCARAVEDAIRFRTAGNVAAFIAEPVLGEGGILIPPRNYFKAVKPILDEHGILFIADEVQSGFARTGRMFAIEHYEVEPDILLTAKGIADGFPLGAFTARDEIADAFQPGDHLSTFGGNPVSCAAAIANIRFIERENLCQKTQAMGERILSAMREWQRRFPLIGEVRGAGLMIGVELVANSKDKTPAAAQAEAIRQYCLERGVLIGVGGVYGNVVRFQPPLVITSQQVDAALNALEDAFKKIQPVA